MHIYIHTYTTYIHIHTHITGRTALHRASNSGHPEVCHLLLQAVVSSAGGGLLL